jgi:hypothetical protein
VAAAAGGAGGAIFVQEGGTLAIAGSLSIAGGEVVRGAAEEQIRDRGYILAATGPLWVPASSFKARRL